MAAVLNYLELRRPTLVGWSFGGRVICDYLLHHGSATVAAINFVAAATTADDSHHGPGVRLLGPAASDDLPTMLDASLDFVAECFAEPPGPRTFARILGYNMLTPTHVRRAMVGRPADYAAVLQTLNVAVLVTHGQRDAVLLPSLSRCAKRMAPTARLSLYPQSGHSPFWEDAMRFNVELSELVTSASAGRCTTRLRHDVGAERILRRC